LNVTRQRRLIVNADDFGQSRGINRGVIEAFENGIVTSASLMVRWPAAEEAVAYAKLHPELSLGLHFDLAEWTYENETWVPRYLVLDEETPEAVSLEVEWQLQHFIDLVGHGPTHLDSHQHVHREEPVQTVLFATAQHLGVPLRDFTTEASYRGDFYGQDSRGYPVRDAISVEALAGLIRGLPAGTTELGCHPGYADDLESMYRDERAREVEALCSPTVRDVITSKQVTLCSFADLVRQTPELSP